MKQLILIAVSLIALSACVTAPNGSLSPTTTDSVFNGSNFYINYDINYYASKDVSYGIYHYSTLTASTKLIDSVHNIVTIKLHAPTGIYGVPIVDFYLLGNGNDTGYFTFATPTSWDDSTISEISFVNPDVVFTDTSGSVHITYNGSDYIEGTFTTNLYTPSSNFPATGNFKIYY